MTAPSSTFLDDLKAAADRAVEAEEDFRRSVAPRTKALETDRAFAFRKLNLMRAVSDAVFAAENDETAVLAATATLRARLGWSSDSAARNEVLTRFTSVVQAMIAERAHEGGEREPSDVARSLAEFETWYATTHPVAFWALFENAMPETPVVDF